MKISAFLIALLLNFSIGCISIKIPMKSTRETSSMTVQQPVTTRC